MLSPAWLLIELEATEGGPTHNCALKSADVCLSCDIVWCKTTMQGRKAVGQSDNRHMGFDLKSSNFHLIHIEGLLAVGQSPDDPPAQSHSQRIFRGKA